MGFTRAELATYRGRTLPDLIGDDVRLLFVGINPGLLTVAMQSHFGRRGNRFYPALYRAGIIDHVIDASNGFDPADVAQLKARGVGITSLVAGATARADELTTAELREGAIALRERVERVRPRVVAMLGITAYRTAFEKRAAVVGEQPESLSGARLWVVPNPSGLNAHETVDSLATAYAEAARAAGIALYEV
ncbi:mismatch-specific DNA-glycosylase [Actinoplanes sp. TBRC 11911]|uniref:mismatch-specific DNA-glycosylase n=1 Tax=Actinoplanes sp. TBRC 11911 TaxID=2729386 RepID=UPI00145E147D|nr:mismatch-specific DNA-glycosylase [Actinoplanes sp. TBRC 11911]NMO49944.1 mismatch-specific DNA-glycosylase [Actinoplanes sp. TBRC 11911]